MTEIADYFALFVSIVVSIWFVLVTIDALLWPFGTQLQDRERKELLRNRKNDDR